MADERHRFMLIAKAAHGAISTGNFDEGFKAIEGLTKGKFDPLDHLDPGYATLGARIKAGQESRSPRLNLDRDRAAVDAAAEKEREKKKRLEEEGRDRQERGGKDRKGRKV